MLESAESAPIVAVVDDDVSVRESLESLVRLGGWQAQTYACAEDFLGSLPPAVPNCLVLDVGLPDISGLDLQQRLAGDRSDIAVVFISGQADVPMSVRAMKHGAVDFLTKPFADTALLRAIDEAIERSRAALAAEREMRAPKEAYATLSRRERQVMGLIVSGLLNKQAGAELGISEITVKRHRGEVMRKMRVRSFADLVKLADRLKRAGEAVPEGSR